MKKRGLMTLRICFGPIPLCRAGTTWNHYNRSDDYITGGSFTSPKTAVVTSSWTMSATGPNLTRLVGSGQTETLSLRAEV